MLVMLHGKMVCWLLGTNHVLLVMTMVAVVAGGTVAPPQTMDITTVDTRNSPSRSSRSYKPRLLA